MRKINVATEIKKILLSKDDGKDLFISVLENYKSGEQSIELDFSDITMLAPAAAEGFVDAVLASNSLSMRTLQETVRFSGLNVLDLILFGKVFNSPATRDSDQVTIQQQKMAADLISEIKSKIAEFRR